MQPIECRDLQIGYKTPLASIDSRFEKGITALMGESGSGKTTLLKTLAGLQEALSGDLIQPYKSVICFQEPLLLEELSVMENLKYVLGSAYKERREEFEAILKDLDLYEVRKQKAKELSGGQRQRLSVAQSLLASPQVFLFDEILSFQDQGHKEMMMDYLTRRFQKQEAIVLWITHSINEAEAISDRILVLKEGRLTPLKEQ